MKKTLKVNTGNKSYSVAVGKGLLSCFGAELKEVAPVSTLLLVSDDKVWSLFETECLTSLKKEGYSPHVHIIPAGEESKNIQHALDLYDAAVEAGMDRSTPVVALGGGVVGDLAGFVAATYLRGVPLIQVPTTLLSQVDSSVGGKVGINHPRGKNLIGAFYQPRLVLIDLETLSSLDCRQYRAGLGEVVKYGIMSDPTFFGWLEKNMESIVRREDFFLIERVVTRCIEIKAKIVNKDEKEDGLRRILNLGHTFGHALEAVTGYSYYLHGEAVLAGMNMAASLSNHLGLISQEERMRMIKLLEQVGILSPPPEVTVEDIFYTLRYDKKRQGSSQVYILPSGVGEVTIYKQPPEDLVKKVIEEYVAGK